MDDADVKLVGVEAAGKGLSTGEHAASINGGRLGVLHGAKTMLLQTADGNVIDDADQTEDPTDFNSYTNDYYEIGFEIPEGFEDVTASAPDNDENMQLECEVSNADGNATASIFLVPAVTSHEGITDIDSWAEDFTNAFVKGLEDQNVQDINTEIADFSIGGVPYGTVCLVDGTINGTTIYNDFYFVLDEDGDGFFVQLYAESEDDINTLRDSFRAL
jgi:hypothetical protein